MPPPQELTQEDIDAAVMHSLETKTPPSVYAKAFEMILPSVVRVKNMHYDQDEDGDREQGSGTGVVIVDNGTILTNLHVVAGSKRITVEFFDGLVSEAKVIGLQPENDLAVIKARDAAGRSRAGDAALDQRSGARRPRRRGRLSVRHRALGDRRHHLRAEARVPLEAKASAS